MIGATVMAAWWLNRNVPGVRWHAFRHYYWTLPLWMFGFLALPLRLAATISGPPLK